MTTGFDQDVHTAVTAAQTLANTWLGKKKPFRFFVQGFAYSAACSRRCKGLPHHGQP
jgi:hypothetical protein